ncbi:MAG: HlyD family efflux transporter periplasmic adaptor subunit [Bryobacteraceae bacterium]
MTAEQMTYPLLPSMSLVKGYAPARRIAWLLALVFVVLVVLLAWMPWQQSISGAGRVTALVPLERQQTISAPVDGRVVRWHVVEGSRVKKGDPVVEVSDNDPSMIDRLRGELTAAREREQSLGDRLAGLNASRENALSAADARISMAVERVSAAERGLEAAEATLLAARLNLERQDQLHKRGLTATRSVELARMDHDRASAEVERSRNALNAAREDHKATLADRQKVQADYMALLEDANASRASATGAVRPIETRLARQSTQQILAPRDGVILRLLAQPGSEMLKAGEGLAILVPDTSSAVVELWVDGNDMPLLKTGDRVRLQFEGWPAIQFVGWPSVAVGTFGGSIILLDATDDGSGRFRILVAPDENDEEWPDARYLRQGVRAKGWVLLRQVNLGFEVWRRFNGFPPSTTPPAKPSTNTEGQKKKK